MGLVISLRISTIEETGWGVRCWEGFIGLAYIPNKSYLRLLATLLLFLLLPLVENTIKATYGKSNLQYTVCIRYVMHLTGQLNWTHFRVSHRVRSLAPRFLAFY